MKKLLLSVLSATLLTISGSAAPFAKVKNNASGNITPRAANDATEDTFVNQMAGFYTSPQSDDSNAGNYYTLLSTNPDDTYVGSTGEVTSKDAMVLFLDLYAPVSPLTDISLSEGTYKMSDAEEIKEPFRYSNEYSMLIYYNSKGEQDTGAYLTEDIIITSNGGNSYTVETTVSYNGKERKVKYTGSLVFVSDQAPATYYTQIRENLDLTLDKGGVAFYHGNLYENNTGNIYINVFDCDYDSETGAMNEDGYSIALCVLGRLFGKDVPPHPLAGVYEGSRSLARGTWFPGMEMDYMGIPMLMGTYVRQKVNGSYRYSYLKTGTVEIEELGDDNYKIVVDAISDLGFTVKATCTGHITTKDNRVNPPASVSTLIEDVDLDLDKIKVSRIYHNGIKRGNRSLVLDIGSPSGKDEELADGGDIMRMEFIVSADEARLLPGTYTVMDNDLDESYVPYKLTKGYFTNSGELVGTRYNHFKQGSYWVFDEYAPAESGTVGVTKNSDDTYTFNIDITDDAGFFIRGSWTGPMLYQYNPDDVLASISAIGADDCGIEVEFVNNQLHIYGAGNAAVEVFSTSGALVSETHGEEVVNLNHLASGVYIVRINNYTTKIIK